MFKEFTAYRESLLTILYIYRTHKFPKAAMLISDVLFDTMVTLDKNQLILKYLLTCEPPAYSCRRYWDWIEPHFISQIQKFSENLGTTAT